MSQPPRPIIGRHRSVSPAPTVTPGQPKSVNAIPAIVGNSIKAIDDLSGGGMNPIWLVSMRQSDTKLIVKAEMELNSSEVPFAKANMKAMSDVMAVVSPTASFARLEESELAALSQSSHRPLTLQTAITEAKAGTKHLTKMKFDPSFFATSAHDPVTMGKSAAMTSDERAKAVLLFSGLRDNSRAWQTLGQIIIADALIGNGDRIDFERARVANFGNLIFSKDAQGNITHALGYDVYNPFADTAKMMFGAGIDSSSQGKPRNANAPDSWIEVYGKHLKDKSTFPAFAKKIIDHVNTERMVPLGLAPYTIDEERYLAEGLVQGWDKQANQVGIKVRSGKGIPSGLMARAKYLGFVK